MTTEKEKIERIFAHKKPAEALVALDAGFGCLLENIRNMDRVLAASLAIDLQETAKQVPLRLPPHVHGAADILDKWATILKSDPTLSDHH